MITEIFTIAKYAALFLCSFYAYVKICKIKLKALNLIDVPVSVALATGLYYATVYIKYLMPILFLVMACVYTLIRYRQPFFKTISINVICTGIVVAASAISPLIAMFFEVFIFIFIKDQTANFAATQITVIVLQTILTLILFSIPRFKSGIKPQKYDGYFEILLVFSSIIIILLCLAYTERWAEAPYEVLFLFIAACGLAIIIDWRRHITNNYRHEIFKRNLQITEKTAQLYEDEKNKLEEQNKKLAKIIHRDNKLIPAMIIAVKQLANGHNVNDAKVDDVLKQLDRLSAEHREILSEYETSMNKLTKTGHFAIDSSMAYLHSKANKFCIEFSLVVENDAADSLVNSIPDNIDLGTLLNDLGENAIIATKIRQVKEIKIAIGLNGNSHPYVTFFDTGEFFSDAVIAKMGKVAITTHENEGGSGIGLITLFEILQKYRASYCLNQNINDGKFTKSISVFFDKKCVWTVIKRSGEIVKLDSSKPVTV